MLQPVGLLLKYIADYDSVLKMTDSSSVVVADSLWVLSPLAWILLLSLLPMLKVDALGKLVLMLDDFADPNDIFLRLEDAMALLMVDDSLLDLAPVPRVSEGFETRK